MNLNSDRDAMYGRATRHLNSNTTRIHQNIPGRLPKSGHKMWPLVKVWIFCSSQMLRLHRIIRALHSTTAKHSAADAQNTQPIHQIYQQINADLKAAALKQSRPKSAPLTTPLKLFTAKQASQRSITEIAQKSAEKPNSQPAGKSSKRPRKLAKSSANTIKSQSRNTYPSSKGNSPFTREQALAVLSQLQSGPSPETRSTLYDTLLKNHNKLGQSARKSVDEWLLKDVDMALYFLNHTPEQKSGWLSSSDNRLLELNSWQKGQWFVLSLCVRNSAPVKVTSTTPTPSHMRIASHWIWRMPIWMGLYCRDSLKSLVYPHSTLEKTWPGSDYNLCNHDIL